jgi:hypothetical protein
MSFTPLPLTRRDRRAPHCPPPGPTVPPLAHASPPSTDNRSDRASATSSLSSQRRPAVVVDRAAGPSPLPTPRRRRSWRRERPEELSSLLASITAQGREKFRPQHLVSFLHDNNQWRGQEKNLAGATSNDRPNQNGKHTNSHVQILQLRQFYAKFIDVASNLKNKNTN